MNTPVPSLWWRWLVILCVVGVLFGVMLVLAPQALHGSLAPLYYDGAVGEGAFEALTEAELRFQNWFYGLAGAVMTGWMLTIAWVVAGPFRRGEGWSWTGIAVSLVVWFVLDSYTSMVNGVAINVLFNLGFLIGFGIPLLATYRHFHPAEAIRPSNTIRSRS